MDVVPTIVDEQIVCHLKSPCKGKGLDCRCVHLVLCIHNWSIINQLPYLILDFQEEKHMCPVFIEELVFLKRRLTTPILLVGLGYHSRQLLQRYNFEEDFQEFPSVSDAASQLRTMGILKTSKHEVTPILALDREIMGEWSQQIEL